MEHSRDAAVLRRGRGTRPVHLACGSSDAFAVHLTVSLHSAVSRVDPRRPVEVTVVDGGIAPRNKERIRRSLSEAHPRAKVEIVTPDPALLAGLPITERYPPAVYSRLFMDRLLPEAVERVLFLDADVVVTEDVSPLFDMEVGGKALWAVRDPFGATDRGMPRLRRDFPEAALPEDAVYFNGGVMLINLPEWRARAVSERTVALIRAQGKRFLYFEQDPMNLVLAEDWGQLEPKWNNIIQGRVATFPEVYEAGDGEGILHFAGRWKPWYWGGGCLREEAYREALLATGWHGPFERVQLELYRGAKGALARYPAVAALRKRVASL